MYLKRDGTQVEHLPVLDDYAKDDPNMGVETAYFVELFDENHHLLGRLENGNTYPNESQRRFYLLKHRRRRSSASSACTGGRSDEEMQTVSVPQELQRCLLR